MRFGGGTGVRAEVNGGKNIVVGHPVTFVLLFRLGRGRPIAFERHQVLNVNLSSVKWL